MSLKDAVKNWLHVVISAILVVFFATTMACAADQEIRIGILSFRPLEQTTLQWQATVDTLNSKIPGYHFSFTPLYYTELDLAANRQDFDFILTNPEHYVTVRAAHGLSAIATLMPYAEGHPVTNFGGVILTLAGRDEINKLEDVRGKVVASPAEQSLGGYLVERWALYKQGIAISEVKRLKFTGMPHDKAILEVLNGQADVAFVRTGVLESMAREGKIDISQFKVINRQPTDMFPQLLSTELYPEWPFSVMPAVPDELAKKVSLVLLNIQPSDKPALEGKYYGFSPPGNYSTVEVLMHRLKVNPEMAHEFSLRDVSHKYALELIGGGLLIFMAMFATAIHLARTNRHLAFSYRERERLDLELEGANATLEGKVAERTRELQESEARFRQMFEHHASPMLLIEPLCGGLVNANQAAADFYGYATAQMKVMNISQINAESPQNIDLNLQRAKKEKCNYFIFPHRLASGEVRTVEVHSSPVEMDGRSLLFSIIHDITERCQLEAQMHDMAFYDPLTKLPNRRLLIDRLEKALVSCLRTRRYGALMFLDLDHFKLLNDLHGHDMGDQLLVEVAARILSCIRDQDSAARFGGDEFLVMLEGLSENMGDAVRQADTVAEKIRAALALPYQLKRNDEIIFHHCSSSIGVTVFLDHLSSLEQLLKWTDMAMYHAKDAGRNMIRFFDPNMQIAIETRAALESDLHDALAQQQFKLYYQIQVDAQGRALGAEVLVRWQHPQRGLVSPTQFISLAEETGLIVSIGEWVLDTACAQIRQWADDGSTDNLVIAVNVSSKQFRQPNFVAQVEKAVNKHKIKAAFLKLELTESLVLDNVEDTIDKMNALKEFGVRFSMDDFGTGYSSLSYLKRLPLDQIKIDQSFVRDITTNTTDMLMVKTILDLGKNFGMHVIAEGVETNIQLQMLEMSGCTSFQGYLFSKPVLIDEFNLLLNRMRQVQSKPVSDVSVGA